VTDPIEAALAPGGIRSAFQPLVDLETGAVLGYEALARGPAVPSDPRTMIDAARAAGRHAEVDWACRAAALRGALEAGLGHGCTLFVNIEPDIPVADVPPEHRELLADAETSLRVVLEVTEKTVVERPAELLRTIDWARDRGWGVALDDLGLSPGSLAVMPFLEPDVVKLDLSLVQRRPEPDIGLIMSAVMAQAERTGATVVAEGIEDDDHYGAALAMGATIGQGWRFGRPGPLADVRRPDATIPLLQARGALREQTPFSVVRGARPMRRGNKRLLNGLATNLEEQAVGWRDGPVILSTFQAGEEVPAATLGRYAALAKRGSYVVVLGVDVEREPAPGVLGAPLQADHRLAGEWSVVVVGPHYAGALVARDLGWEDGGDRQYDYAVTHDRGLVVEAGRALLRQVAPAEEAAFDVGGTPPEA